MSRGVCLGKRRVADLGIRNRSESGPLPVLHPRPGMTGTLVYRKKWVHPLQSNLSCVGFSTTGEHIAYGGNDGLIIASVQDGRRRVIVQNLGSVVTAIEWVRHNTAICAFNDGIIANIVFEPVRPTSFTRV